MSQSILPPGEQQFSDANGRPYVGGKVYFYIPNTLTPKNTYQDQDSTILNTNPVILDSAGRAVIWGEGNYRQILNDKNGNTVWDRIVSYLKGTEAASVSIGDAGNYYTVKNVEGALQEVGINEVKQITSAAALRVLTPANWHYVFILGADGGLFYRDASDTTSVEDGGTYCGTIIRGADYAMRGVWKRAFDAEINVKWFGAAGDGAVNDTDALQMAIDAVAASVLRTGQEFIGGCALVIPGGRYIVTSRIIHPPYVKIRTSGTVIIDADVTADSAWHITPISTDPSDIGGIGKERWNTGSVLDGSNGGFILRNSSASRTGRTGLERGSRQDLGASRYLSRYSIRDIAVTGFDIADQLNAKNHFIAYAYGMRYEQNNTNIKYGASGITAVNAGENLNWIDSVIASADVGVQIASDGPGIKLRGCSIDYLERGIQFDAGYVDVLVIGGWLENFNAVDLPSAGIVVSNYSPVSDLGRPRVTIQGFPRVVNSRQTLFRGDFALTAELDIPILTVASYEYADSCMCDTAVKVRSVKTERDGFPYISRSYEFNRDPVFAGETNGTLSSALVNYAVAGSSGASCSVTDSVSPYSGAKALDYVFSAGAAFHLLQMKAYIPVRPGNVVKGCLSVYVPAATGYVPSTDIGVTWYDSERVIIGARAGFGGIAVQSTKDKWITQNYAARFSAPAGVAYCRIDYQLSTTAGDGIAHVYASAFSAHIAH